MGVQLSAFRTRTSSVPLTTGSDLGGIGRGPLVTESESSIDHRPLPVNRCKMRVVPDALTVPETDRSNLETLPAVERTYPRWSRPACRQRYARTFGMPSPCSRRSADFP